MQPEVVVVGSFVQDLTFLCETFPQPGETTIGRFLTGPGGKGSNQAVAAARAGARVRFIGAVGADPFSASAEIFLRAEGIDARLVSLKKHPTATAGIIVNQAGQNQIVVALGASAHLTASGVPESLLRRARIVLAQHEANLALNAHVFRVARRLGAKTVLNPAPMRPDFNASILHDVDVLIPNENEFVTLAQQLPACSSLIRKPPFKVGGSFTAGTLSQVPATAMQQLCRAFGVPVLIVTLGKRGCFVSLPDRCEHVPAHVVEVVDSTGAGDAFVGGFAAGWIKFKNNALLAARYANAVAALSVTKFGTARSMPRRAEIERFLRQQTKSQRPAKSSSRKQKPARSI